MVRYNQTPSGGGVGLNEYNLHQATGLRNATLNAVIASSPWGTAAGGTLTTWGSIAPNTDGTNITPIGNADGSRMGTWPTVSLRSAATPWNSILPIPMTPTLFFLAIPGPTAGIASAPWPQTVEVRIRMIGRDQFGNAIEEITPWVSKTSSTTSQVAVINMSKVFSVVHDAWVMTDNVWDTAPTFSSSAAIGWHTCIDPTKAQAMAATIAVYQTFWLAQNAAAIVSNFDFCGTAANWGIGTPHMVTPYGQDMPVPTPEILGATMTLLRQKTTPTALNTVARVLSYKGVVGGLGPNASGTSTGTAATTLTDSGAGWITNAYAGFTVTTGGRTGVVASNTGTVLTLTAAGWSGTTPSSGQAYTIEAKVLAGIRLGQNVAGWQGTPHKIGFFSNDSWVANKVSGIDLTGLSTRTIETGTSTATAATTLTDGGKSWVTNAYAGWIVSSNGKFATVTSNTGTVLTVPSWTGGTPTSGQAYTISPNEGMLGEDEIMLSSLLRTTYGTRRQSGSERNYPNG